MSINKPVLNIKEISELKTGKKTLEEIYYKSYHNKPHLADLPYDRRSTDKSELEERIKEIDKRIKKEIEEQEKRKKSIKNWEKSYKEYQQEIKKEEENIKTKTKSVNQLFQLVDDNVKDFKEDLSNLEKGLYYEDGKKLTQSQLESKWSEPDDPGPRLNRANNSLQSLKVIQDGLEDMKRREKSLKDNLEKFKDFQGRSEANKLAGNFEQIGRTGAKVDAELEKVSGNLQSVPFLREINNITHRFEDYGGERYRVHSIKNYHDEIYKHNKSKDNYAHLSESIEQDIDKYSQLLNESERRLQDYKDEKKRTQDRIESVS